MDISWHIVWKSALIVVSGIILLRLSGRKSIAQMTVATTVIMISIGEILAQAIVENKIWRSVVAVGLFLITLMALEWLELKSKLIQRLLSGEPVTVIREGRIDEQALGKLRITRQQLEMRLRQEGITSMDDIQNATIEINGELGYELQKHAQPVTVGEMEKLLERYLGGKQGTR